jgi:hypothetical protein
VADSGADLRVKDGDRLAKEKYSDAFTFTGTIKRVTLDLSGDLIPDTEADMRIAMARQ